MPSMLHRFFNHNSIGKRLHQFIPKRVVQHLAENARNRARVRALKHIFALFTAIFIVVFVYWFFVLRFYESTDDAYVAGNIIMISSQVSGNVADIHVDNTSGVKMGQPLVSLDKMDAELSLEQGRVNLASAVRQTYSLTRDVSRLRAVVGQRQTELVKTKEDYARRRNIKGARTVSLEDLSHAKDNLAIAEDNVRASIEELRSKEALLLNTPVEKQPAVLLAEQQLRSAWLNYVRCQIKSPVDGFVAKRSVQVGSRVSPGVPLMAVVPLLEVWVDANFKEVQLAHVRIGQNATVSTDFYGSNVTYHGKVAGLAAGTGSSFSLLPPENATGNWIKVVQRLPVKITLDSEEVAKYPLRVGLSCKVEIDISDTSGEVLMSVPVSKPVFSTNALAQDMKPIEEEIAQIIKDNKSSSPAD